MPEYAVAAGAAYLYGLHTSNGMPLLSRAVGGLPQVYLFSTFFNLPFSTLPPPPGADLDGSRPHRGDSTAFPAFPRHLVRVMFRGLILTCCFFISSASHHFFP